MEQDLLTVDLDKPSSQLIRANDRSEELGSAGTVKPKDAKNLASLEFETDIRNACPCGKSTRSQNDTRMGPPARRSGRSIQLSAVSDDQQCKIVGGSLARDRSARDDASISHDRNPIADADDLLEPMRDIDDRRPVALLELSQ
jgi:hypothetical protein